MDLILEAKKAKHHLIRQWDLIPDAKLSTPVTIIGAGAIGSFVALQLAKMGMDEITVWDHDEVSVENMSAQFYRFKDIGSNKTTALKELVLEFTGTEIRPFVEKWVPSHELTKGIVIVAVDSMDARSEIFDAIREDHYLVNYIIDPRMGAEHAAMYVMNPHDAKDVATYRKTLYKDTEAVQERCTAKSTIYTANLLSGLVVQAVKNILADQAFARVTNYAIGDHTLVQHKPKKDISLEMKIVADLGSIRFDAQADVRNYSVSHMTQRFHPSGAIVLDDPIEDAEASNFEVEF